MEGKNFEKPRQCDDDYRRRSDARISKHFHAREEKLKSAKWTHTQTICDSKIEAT
jgi:hypothetical protein